MELSEPIIFEWNQGNIGKNAKHNVDDKEAEEVFFDKNNRNRKRTSFICGIYNTPKQSQNYLSTRYK